MAYTVSFYLHDAIDLDPTLQPKIHSFELVGDAIGYAQYLWNISRMGFATIDNGQRIFMIGFTNTPLGRDFAAKGATNYLF